MKCLLALCLALSVAVCSSVEVKAQPATKDKVSGFALNFFREVAKQRPRENLLVSPVSVATCVTMAYAGADGGTKEAMARVLGLSGSDEQVFAAAKEVLDSLRKPGSDTKLEIANALFGSKFVKFKDKFVTTNKTSFDAEVSVVDFTSPATLTKINSWVAQQTHDRIKTILSGLDPKMILVLINAIYFKGSWEHPFSKTLTKPADFHLLDGGTKKVSMMSMSRSDFQFLENEDFQAVSLPYADKRLSMYIFLPSNIKPMSEFEAQLSPAKWEELVSRFQTNPGELKMPRFKVEDDLTLNGALQQMGMGIAFQQKNANFLEMAELTEEEYLYISDVLHKTYMEVNEEGTEAAAVTAITMARGSGMAVRKVPFRMVVDRPFIVAIRDNRTGSLLFIGHVVDPPAAGG